MKFLASRNVQRFLLVFNLLFIACMLTACTATWVTQAQAIVTGLIGASGIVLQLISLLSGKTIPADIVSGLTKYGTLIINDLTLVAKLIDEYTAANATTITADINAALAAVKNNLSDILTGIRVVNQETQDKITQIVGLVIAEVNAIEVLIPNLLQAKPKELQKLTAERRMSHKEFVKAFNTILHQPTGNADVDAVCSQLSLEDPLPEVAEPADPQLCG